MDGYVDLMGEQTSISNDILGTPSNITFITISDPKMNMFIEKLLN